MWIKPLGSPKKFVVFLFFPVDRILICSEKHRTWCHWAEWAARRLTSARKMSLLVLRRTCPTSACPASILQALPLWKCIQNEGWALVMVTLYFSGICEIYLLTGAFVPRQIRL